MRNVLVALVFVLSGTIATAWSGEKKPPEPVATRTWFRTDGGDEKIPWYQTKNGEFPPEGSAHYIAGELIQMDFLNRTGQLRPDRINGKREDTPCPFTMLPYGSIRYHGGPAQLRDIPYNTHLHGLFYFDPKGGRFQFPQCYLLEDDFSFQERQHRTWRIDAIDLEKGNLTVTGQCLPEKKTDEKQLIFKITSATRVWKGKGFGALTDLAVGQSVACNLTVCMLKGPGRCTEIWLDEESRKYTSEFQRDVDRAFQKLHGLPGWIDTVDNEKGQFTITLFGAIDPQLKTEFKVDGRVFSLTAEPNLRTWDQNNVRMGSKLLDIRTVPAAPGSSGVQFLIKPDDMLEGFRPGRFLRIIAEKWGVEELPPEENMSR